MARKARRTSSGRRQLGGGRVTLPPCPLRGDGLDCAPLNHIVHGDREYWSCSCGRRYSKAAYARYVRDQRDWTDR